MLNLSNKEDLTSLPNKSGIYAFRNIINGKYYIGQSLNINTRVYNHITAFNKKFKPNYPIYRAFKKYGLDKFEILILYVLDNNSANKKEIKHILDEYEKKFINEYNSYGSTGYNQTKGGDGGILGYKFSDKQKQIASINSKKVMADGRNRLYLYNINTSEIKEFNTKYDLMSFLNIKSFSTGSVRNLIFNNNYIIERTLEKLNNKILKYKNKNKNNTRWYNGIKKQIPENFKEYYLSYTKEETCNYFNISQPTLYKWCKELNIRKQKILTDKDVIDIIKYYNSCNNKSETSRYFNIERGRLYRILKNYETENIYNY